MQDEQSKIKKKCFLVGLICSYRFGDKTRHIKIKKRVTRDVQLFHLDVSEEQQKKKIYIIIFFLRENTFTKRLTITFTADGLFCFLRLH